MVTVGAGWYDMASESTKARPAIDFSR